MKYIKKTNSVHKKSSTPVVSQSPEELKGEVSGAFFVGLVEAFRTVQMLSEDITNIDGICIDEMKPEGWYPHQLFYKLVQKIDQELAPAPSIYFMAGLNFMRNWYDHGPGKEMVFCSRDWLLANKNSAGYNSVVRGGLPNEIGSCMLREYDEEDGIAVYDDICVFNPDYLRGVFWGGCALFDDLDYYNVTCEEGHDSPHPLLIHSIVKVKFRMRKHEDLKENVDRLIKKHIAQKPINVDSEVIDSLIWQYRHLLNKYELEISYRRDLFRLLTKTLEESEYLREDAEAANKAKSMFLANMSHEIRTPMNAILGFTEILKGIEHDPKKYHYIDNIHVSGKALLNLINDILDLSKIEAGKLELSYCSCSIESLFQEMKTLFNHNIVDKGLELIIEIDGDLPSSLILDGNRMRQVIINLIGNALKFTEHGHIRLTARGYQTYIETRSRYNLIIEVDDTGIGIPEDQHNKIFGAFEQTKGQDAEKFGGTGLGLAISNRLIKMMGGTISIESEVDKGSKFIIEIKEVEIAATEAQSEKEELILDYDTILFAPSTILLVDDINFNREMLSNYLMPFNFNLIEAENGKVAIEQAKKHKPDLILLDMKMPVMDGYEAATIIKQDKDLVIPIREYAKDGTIIEKGMKPIPVIAVTASALLQDEARIEACCDGYLRKPVSKSVVISQIMKHIPYRLAEDIKPAEKTREVDTKAKITADILKEFPVLVNKLKPMIIDTSSLIENMDVIGIMKFVAIVRELAKEHSCTPLENWANLSDDAINNFSFNDIRDQMAMLLDAI